MQSIDDKIVNSLSKCGRGVAFSAARFAHYGNADAVRKAIARLCNKNTVIRLAKGIYYYPKIDKDFGLGVIYSTADDIATAIAKRHGAKIVPTGVYALNRLGLSTQVPTNFVYLTDGKTRKILLENGRYITFVHTALKNLQFKNYIAMLITFALKSIGNENVTEQQIAHIQNIIKQEGKEKIMQDIAKMPDWIKKIITKTND